MAHHDARVERLPEQSDDAETVPVTYRSVDDVPAARLLAHDLEHLKWDDDDETVLPPPD